VYIKAWTGGSGPEAAVDSRENCTDTPALFFYGASAGRSSASCGSG